MDELKIAICDDDQMIQRQVKDMIKKYFSNKHIKIHIELFNDGEELLQDSEVYKIIILDIEMKRKDGLEVSEVLEWNNVPSKIIFLTDHDELMEKAFGTCVCGFVKKNNITGIYPYLDKIMKKYNAHQMISLAGEKIDKYDILYIKGCRSYCTVYLVNQTNKIVRNCLSAMEQLLYKNLFIRVHRSYIVNVIHIKKCETNKVILKNNVVIPVSKRYQDLLENAFFEYIGRLK